ncbi:MAG: 50S ribosomal protein L17 [Bacteroidetes bacterium]|jgi:large subunit ribosomal protein L17|nr:50S ribosomal protein L17 [Bacteroidota bacterium]
MRHQKSGRKLKRTASHRRATLSALSVALITHKRIKTTLAKAKELRLVVEPVITRAKNAVSGETADGPKNVHARRVTFAFLRDRDAVTALYKDIAPKVASRPGGYTRVVKLGRRPGDGAEMAVIELVDFQLGAEKPAAKPAAKKDAKGTKKKSAGARKTAPKKQGKESAEAPAETPSASA